MYEFTAYRSYCLQEDRRKGCHLHAHPWTRGWFWLSCKPHWSRFPAQCDCRSRVQRGEHVPVRGSGHPGGHEAHGGGEDSGAGGPARTISSGGIVPVVASVQNCNGVEIVETVYFFNFLISYTL